MSSSLSKRVQQTQHNSRDSNAENSHYRKSGMDVFRRFSTTNQGRVLTHENNNTLNSAFRKPDQRGPYTNQYNVASGEGCGPSDSISASERVTWQMFAQAILFYGVRSRVSRHPSDLLETAVALALSHMKTQKKVWRLNKRRGRRG